jgi:hypothetical protein
MTKKTEEQEPTKRTPSAYDPILKLFVVFGVVATFGYYLNINQEYSAKYTSYSRDIVNIVKPMMEDESEILASEHTLVFREFSLNMTVKPYSNNRHNAILHFEHPVSDKFCLKVLTKLNMTKESLKVIADYCERRPLNNEFSVISA